MFSRASVILFTGGSLSEHAPRVRWRGGGLCPGGLYLVVSVLGDPSPGGLCLRGLCPGVSVQERVFVQGGLCPGGSLSSGVSVQGSLSGGLCPGGSLLGRPPLHGNELAVRILLECISVFNMLFKIFLAIFPTFKRFLFLAVKSRFD